MSAKRPVARPRLTKKRVEGLFRIMMLAEADLESDRESFPKADPAWDGIVYLRELRYWFNSNIKGQA